MNPRHRLIATASFATLAVGLLGHAWAEDGPKLPSVPGENTRAVYPPNATAAEKQEIDLLRVRVLSAEPAMRKKLLAAYPFESLEARLEFDAPGRKRVAKSFPTADVGLARWKPHLNTERKASIPPATLATLMAEERLAREGYFDRIQALASLHQVEVRKFVTNPGFGVMRLARIQSSAEPPPADWSEGDRGEPVHLPKTGDFFTTIPDKKGPTLPSVFALAGFHTSTAHEFARPDSWGLVKDRQQVAGFRPHTLEFIPDENARRRYDQEHPIKDRSGRVTGYPVIERWAVRKVELVGLLIHESPVVYQNPDNKLPTMADARDAKTRGLTEFESKGLKDLAAGKEVVAVDAVTNQVRMVGAIRMAAACTKCHEGSPGDLLGAFTYDLVRVPAFVAEEK